MTNSQYRWVKGLIEDPENPNELILEIGEACAELGWKEGDEIEWIDNRDGSWTLKRVN